MSCTWNNIATIADSEYQSKSIGWVFEHEHTGTYSDREKKYGIVLIEIRNHEIRPHAQQWSIKKHVQAFNGM